MRLAILTPRLVGREGFWEQCRDSIRKDAPHLPHLTIEPEANKTTSAGQAMNILCQRAVDMGFSHYFQVSDDDWLNPGWYEALMAPFEADPAVEATGSDIRAHMEDGRVWTWGAPRSIDQIATESIPFHITDLEVWARSGGYPEDIYASDWRMLAAAHRVQPVKYVWVPGPWYNHRRHPATETAQMGGYNGCTMQEIRTRVKEALNG